MDTPQLAADSQHFEEINPELRALLRTAELDMRSKLQEAFREAFSHTPEDILAEIRPTFDLLARGIPANMVTSLLSVWRISTDLMATRDLLMPAAKSNQIH